MNKKFALTIVLISIIGALASALLNQDEPSVKDESPLENVSVSSTETLPSRPQPKDLSELKKEIKLSKSEEDFFEKTNDFSIDTQDLFETMAPNIVYSASKAIINSISKCISSFCAMKPDDDGFFDPENTIADKILARNLELLDLVGERGNLFEFNIEDIDFENIFISQNQDVQKNALRLYLKHKNTQQDLLYLFDMSQGFKEEVKGVFYSSLDLTTKQDPYLRETYLLSINKELLGNNNLAKVEILKNVKHYGLDQEEYKIALGAICKEEDKRIVKILEVHLKEIEGKSKSIKEICE